MILSITRSVDRTRYMHRVCLTAARARTARVWHRLELPDRLMDVTNNNGSINVDGRKVHLSHAFSGHAVGLQGFEHGYRVWFFHVLPGTSIPGTHETLQPQPAVVEEL